MSNTFFTASNWQKPDNVLELIEDTLVSDEVLKVLWDNTGDVHIEQWPGLEDWDSLEMPPRDHIVNGLLAAFKEFFDGLEGREVSWMLWKDEDTGVTVQQWITGGLSWGDWPTEAGQLWYDLLDDAVHGLAPELPGKLGIYYNPFVAAKAIAVGV